VTLAEKLQLKPGAGIRVLHAPAGLALDLPADPAAEAALLFVTSLAELDARAPSVLKTLVPDALFWIAYPKKTGAIRTDIHRDCGWPPVTAAGLEGVRLVAIDATWSAMRFRPVSR
jgi:hypothetical protein